MSVATTLVGVLALHASGYGAMSSGTSSPATLGNELTGSLASLALNTGGLQIRWTSDLTAGLSRMIQDSRQYYRIAYAQPDPPPGRKQPETRATKVKVSRDGVSVRARQRYAPTNASEQPIAHGRLSGPLRIKFG